MQVVYLIDIIDGANFNNGMTRTRAFSTMTAAYEYAEKQVSYFRHARAAEGEMDQTFIDAIYSELTEVPLDQGF